MSFLTFDEEYPDDVKQINNILSFTNKKNDQRIMSLKILLDMHGRRREAAVTKKLRAAQGQQLLNLSIEAFREAGDYSVAEEFHRFLIDRATKAADREQKDATI